MLLGFSPLLRRHSLASIEVLDAVLGKITLPGRHRRHPGGLAHRRRWCWPCGQRWHPNGLGSGVVAQQQALRPDPMFANVVVIGLLGLALNALLCRRAAQRHRP